MTVLRTPPRPAVPIAAEARRVRHALWTEAQVRACMRWQQRNAIRVALCSADRDVRLRALGLRYDLALQRCVPL